MKKIEINKLSEFSGGDSGGTACYLAPIATLALASATIFGAYNTMKPVLKACWNS